MQTTSDPGVVGQDAGRALPPRGGPFYRIRSSAPQPEWAFVLCYRIIASLIAFCFSAIVSLAAGLVSEWTYSSPVLYLQSGAIVCVLLVAEYLRVHAYGRYREHFHRESTRRVVEQLLSSIALPRGQTNASAAGKLRAHGTRKRVLDLVLVSIAILVLAPLIALISLLIKLDSPGPVITGQWRIGRDRRPFLLLKFRTASLAPDAYLTDPQDPHRTFLDNAAVAPEHLDQSITRVGRYLRRTALDELPQLFNVLRGDMSLVGPRPLRPLEAGRLAADALRHHARPGITGPLQVSARVLGRGRSTDLQLDDMYVRNWSLGLDLRLLVRTVSVVFWEMRH